MEEFNGVFACSGVLGSGGLGHLKYKPWEVFFLPYKTSQRLEGVISKTFTLFPRKGNLKSYFDAFKVLKWISFDFFSKALKQIEIQDNNEERYHLVFEKLVSLKEQYQKQKIWPIGWVNSIGLTNEGVQALEKHYLLAKKVGIKLIPSIKGYSREEWIELIERTNRLNTPWQANLSCPNVPEGIVEYEKLEELLRLFREHSKTKIIIKISLATDYVKIAKLAEEVGIDALDCFNSIPWRFLFPGVKSPLKFEDCGVSGWLNRAFVLEGIKRIRRVGVKLPIIAGSVTCWRDILELKRAGATGISLGSGVFLPLPLKVKKLIKLYNQFYK